ncbi:permease prefix domain 1-containing protein [Pseudonocardia sp. TRM90224]|uniref:permease prefix domain 1-containing protein n=1 Tax=Pseudonocardia sp. TRM90224 TaxID=2812678 RepID=UPI001E4CF5C7|nr:permease prefix domain 1-containing protein [Pseudonocardia sp. TRM90224]
MSAPTVVGGTIAAHVEQLARALRGPARSRASMLRETREGLEDAAAAHREGGLAPAEAEALAVRQFGSVRQIAPLYQAELTVRQSRRTALLLAVLMPALTHGWDMLWTIGISWEMAGPPPQIVLTLADAQDKISNVATVVAVALLLMTFLRRTPSRFTGRAVAATAVVTALVTTAVCLGMQLGNSRGTDAMLAATPLAAVAFVVSSIALAVMIFSGLRTLYVTRGERPRR